MLLRRWEDLPDFMRISEVRPYWEILNQRKMTLFFKRIFDLLASIFLLLVLAIPMALIAIYIRIGSPGPIFYRQERVTTYGKKFKIHKFRTMVANADKIGSQVTMNHDKRVTKEGAFLRKYRMDEFPQLFDVLLGDMSFVGTRPETVKYLKSYTKEMYATLLLPAGITSEASIRYKDEAALLNIENDLDRIYEKEVLPNKMKYNLYSIKNISIMNDISIMCRTALVVLGKNY